MHRCKARRIGAGESRPRPCPSSRAAGPCSGPSAALRLSTHPSLSHMPAAGHEQADSASASNGCPAWIDSLRSGLRPRPAVDPSLFAALRSSNSVLIHARHPNCCAIWLPVVGDTPNFLERIRLISETFPSGAGQLCQFAGANAAALRIFWRSGFAPFASKIFSLIFSSFAPNGRQR